MNVNIKILNVVLERKGLMGICFFFFFFYSSSFMEASWRRVHCRIGSMERKSLTPVWNRVSGVLSHDLSAMFSTWVGKERRCSLMEETRHFNSFVTSHYQKGVTVPYNEQVYTVHSVIIEKREEMTRNVEKEKKKSFRGLARGFEANFSLSKLTEAFCGGYICHHVSWNWN